MAHQVVAERGRRPQHCQQPSPESRIVTHRQPQAGRIRRLWRIPGRRANWGLWEAPDASELHAAIRSLPFFPWLQVDVHPLAAHPSDPDRPGGA